MNDEISILDFLTDWDYCKGAVQAEDVENFFKQLEAVLNTAYASGAAAASADLLRLNRPATDEKIELLLLVQKLVTTEFLSGYSAILENSSRK